MGVRSSAKRGLWRALLFVSCVLGNGAWAAPSQAQSVTAQPEYLPNDPDERDKQARQAFEEGKKSYENGEYRDAWGHFHDAYQLSSRPELLYNIGQTADRLGMDADARKAFKLYLERLPNAQNRREVENRIRALEDRVARRADAPAPPGGDANSADAIFGPNSATGKDGGKTSTDAPAPPSGGPRRQGWYFRGALGLGLRRDGLSGGSISGSATGAGASLDLAVGTTILPGLVLGGGLFVDATSRPTLSLKGMGDSTFDTSTLSVIAAMGDWYLRHELDGWHVQGALGLALLSYSRSSVTPGSSVGTNSGSGGALILGGGYEWPIDGDWAIGALGRFVFASVSEGVFSHGVFTTSVLASVTWY